MESTIFPTGSMNYEEYEYGSFLHMMMPCYKGIFLMPRSSSGQHEGDGSTLRQVSPVPLLVSDGTYTVCSVLLHVNIQVTPLEMSKNQTNNCIHEFYRKRFSKN